MVKHRFLRLVAAVLLTALLAGCGAEGVPDTLPAGAEPYAIPPFHDAAFHPESALNCGIFQLDDSALSQGYIALTAQSEKTLKFQVSLGENTYTYTIPGDGSPVILPLNMGDGWYTFRMLENAGGDKYAGLWMDGRQVTLEDEFQCFLRPSQMVSYTYDSQCAVLARQLAQSCQTDADVAAAIYRYVVKNIRYDNEKAASVQPGYLPDPDTTLAEKKGICFDYASLTAAMLRSLGIPCKLITGYVDDALYHAWNMFYLEDSGWVTAEIKVSGENWNRVDLTFAAGGTDTKSLTDDSRYTTRYTY